MAKVEKGAKKAPVNKTPELAAAKKNLEDYLKKHKLDPTKDYSKDKKHGKNITELLSKLNKERDKAAAKYPESDPKQMKKIEKIANSKVKHIERELKKDTDTKATRSSAKYDYPLVDGREMTSAEKKKYRAEQRKLTGTKTDKKEKVEKTHKPTKEVKVSTKEVSKKKTISKKSKVQDED